MIMNRCQKSVPDNFKLAPHITKQASFTLALVNWGKRIKKHLTTTHTPQNISKSSISSIQHSFRVTKPTTRIDTYVHSDKRTKLCYHSLISPNTKTEWIRSQAYTILSIVSKKKSLLDNLSHLLCLCWWWSDRRRMKKPQFVESILPT